MWWWWWWCGAPKCTIKSIRWKNFSFYYYSILAREHHLYSIVYIMSRRRNFFFFSFHICMHSAEIMEIIIFKNENWKKKSWKSNCKLDEEVRYCNYIHGVVCVLFWMYIIYIIYNATCVWRHTHMTIWVRRARNVSSFFQPKNILSLY